MSSRGVRIVLDVARTGWRGGRFDVLDLLWIKMQLGEHEALPHGQSCQPVAAVTVRTAIDVPGFASTMADGPGLGRLTCQHHRVELGGRQDSAVPRGREVSRGQGRA